MYANMFLNKTASGKETLRVGGIDLSGCPYNIFKTVGVNDTNKPYAHLTEAQMANNSVYSAKMTFMGHYNEPELEIEVPRTAFTKPNFRIKMIYCPFQCKWISVTGLDCGTSIKFAQKAPVIEEKKEEEVKTNTSTTKTNT